MDWCWLCTMWHFLLYIAGQQPQLSCSMADVAMQISAVLECHVWCCNSSEMLLAVQEDDEAEDLDAADQDADVSDESLDREEL